MKLGLLLFIWLASLLAVASIHDSRPVAMIEDVKHADYQTCVTVKRPPLLRTPKGRLDYREGRPSNDRGLT